MQEYIESYIPITVFSPVLIFLYKEVSNYFRRLRASRNIKKVLITLIGSELRINYRVYGLNTNVFNSVATHLGGKALSWSYTTSRTGEDYCVIKDNDFELHSPVPKLRTDNFDRLCEKVAELSPKLFDQIHEAYENIRLINRARDIVAAILAKEANAQEIEYAKYLLEKVNAESTKIKESMASAHEALSGKSVLE